MEQVSRGSDGRRLFTAELKREQIDRILRGEVTASELSRELGIARSLIQRWKYLATKGAEAAVSSNMHRKCQGGADEHGPVKETGRVAKVASHDERCFGHIGSSHAVELRAGELPDRPFN